jgi:hypothetical protein
MVERRMEEDWTWREGVRKQREMVVESRTDVG